MTDTPAGPGLDREVCSYWRLTPGQVLGDRASGTWSATRDGAALVADFALSWRGYHDDVLRGYDEVRSLSDLEWQLVRPVFWAWLFLGLKDQLAAHYGDTDSPSPAPNLQWQISHLRNNSALLTEKAANRQEPP